MLVTMAAFVALNIGSASLRRVSALERQEFANMFHSYSNFLALLSEDGGSVIQNKVGIRSFRMSDGTRIYDEPSHVIEDGRAVTDSQYAHITGPRFARVFNTGVVIAAPRWNVVYSQFGAYLAKMYPSKRGQRPNVTIRFPRGVYLAGFIGHSRGVAAYNNGDSLYLLCNLSSDKKRVDLRPYFWDGKSKRVAPAKANGSIRFTRYTGALDIGSFRMYQADIPSGKVLYHDAKRFVFREYDVVAKTSIEFRSPLQYAYPTVTYFRGHLLCTADPLRVQKMPLMDLDRRTKTWKSLGDYELIGFTASQRNLLLRDGRGRVFLGSPF